MLLQHLVLNFPFVRNENSHHPPFFRNDKFRPRWRLQVPLIERHDKVSFSSARLLLAG